MDIKKNEQSLTDTKLCYEYIIISETSRVQSDGVMTTPADDSLNATQLFSFFTADIIKQEALFTR